MTRAWTSYHSSVLPRLICFVTWCDIDVEVIIQFIIKLFLSVVLLAPLPAQKHYQLLTAVIHVLEFDLLQCSETEKETQIITDQTVTFSI